MLLIDGTTLFPMQLRGKVVLTVFWATWCPICMRELPEYQRLRDKYAQKGFEVVALSVDDGAEEVREYLRRAQLKFPVAMRTPALKEAWGPIQGTPLLFLSDRDGVIRAKHLGAPEITELESRIQSLLGSTPAQSTRASFKRQS